MRSRTSQGLSTQIRNVQLSAWSLVISFVFSAVESRKATIVALWDAGPVVAAGSDGTSATPFLDGFTALVYLIVALQVAGGLCTALVLKCAECAVMLRRP